MKQGQESLVLSQFTLCETLQKAKYISMIETYKDTLYHYSQYPFIYLGEGENGFVFGIGNENGYVVKLPFSEKGKMDIIEEKIKHREVYNRLMDKQIKQSAGICIIPKIYEQNKDLLIMDKLDAKTLFHYWVCKKNETIDPKSSDYEIFSYIKGNLDKKKADTFVSDVHMSRELSLNKKEIMKTRNTLRPFFVDPFGKDRGRILLHNFESILQALKGANIRHNDLHMRNIMIYPDNRIGLIDFGLTTFS